MTKKTRITALLLAAGGAFWLAYANPSGAFSMLAMLGAACLVFLTQLPRAAKYGWCALVLCDLLPDRGLPECPEKTFAVRLRRSLCCCVYIHSVQGCFCLHGLRTKLYSGISQGQTFRLNKSFLQG